MKKVIFGSVLALGLVAFTSCKKDYTCDCTYTWEFDGVTTEYEFSYSILKAKKSDAQANCDDYASTWTTGDYVYDCTLNSK